MEKSTEEKVNQAMDFITRDRMVAEDPYFTARLMGRTGHYFSGRRPAERYAASLLRLRPLLAVAFILLGLSAGIFLGSRLTNVLSADPVSERAALVEQFSQEHFITEINGTFEEQLLSNK